MIYYGINDIYRKEMYKYDEKQILLFFDELDSTIKNIYLRIMVTDGLQVLERRRQYNESDQHSKRLYKILSNSDFEHIKSVLEDNYVLFQVLFVNAKGFYKMPIVDRCLLVGERENKNLNYKLLSLNSFYLVDACVYTIQKDIDSIHYYYNDYQNKLGSKHLKSFYQLVLVMMEKLKEENANLYNKNFLEFLKNFYVGNKFLQSIDEISSLETKLYHDMLEKEELDYVISLLESTPEDLMKVLAISLAYHSDMAGTKEEKNFINKNVSSDMIKKLKLNNN